MPIQERAGAIALAADDTVLVIGTESGRVLLWEVFYAPAWRCDLRQF